MIVLHCLRYNGLSFVWNLHKIFFCTSHAFARFFCSYRKNILSNGFLFALFLSVFSIAIVHYEAETVVKLQYPKAKSVLEHFLLQLNRSTNTSNNSLSGEKRLQLRKWMDYFEIFSILFHIIICEFQYLFDNRMTMKSIAKRMPGKTFDETKSMETLNECRFNSHSRWQQLHKQQHHSSLTSRALLHNQVHLLTDQTLYLINE